MNKNLNEFAKVAVNKGYTLEECGSQVRFFLVKGNMQIEVSLSDITGTIYIKTYFTTPEGCHSWYNPTIYREGTRCQLFDGYTPTPKNLAKILDEVEYMQANNIKCYKKGA
jgi:hypothetical protein|nr:MAG TPA: hypothetical protein [Caudoviricetes sp.]